jgi:hypothetical protein
MCAKEWDKINFSHVPSVASSRYQTAFHRNADEQYQVYKDNLTKDDGSAKVNAGAVYPYDVIKPALGGRYGDDIITTNKEVILAQWNALPNYVGDEKILPLVDTSGSMSWTPIPNSTLTPMDVALSLGLYLADKNTGSFKDMFLNFSSDSHINILGGDLFAKLRQLKGASWGGSTNLESAFRSVLNVGTQNKVAAEDMPGYILILSDMQFNCVSNNDASAMQMIEDQYAAAGYKVPKIVFWNLAARSDNAPVRFDKSGAALVSGFSPAIMKSILAAQDFTPKAIMLDAVNIPRYSVV